RALGLRRHLRCHRRRARHGHRDPQPLRLSPLLHRAQPRLRRGGGEGAARDHARGVGLPLCAAEGPGRVRNIVVRAVATPMLLGSFPVAWGLLTSFKTERDVLAYPPSVIFEPTLVNYADVLFGATAILPTLVSSVIVSGLTTVVTMLFAIPAAYALSRLDLPF